MLKDRLRIKYLVSRDKSLSHLIST